MVKIFELKKSKDGTEFKIQETGMNWTLYVKEKGQSRWVKIQSDVDAKFLHQVMMNQKEFQGSR